MATTVSGWTASELDTRISAIKDAIAAAETGKAYTFNGRSVTRQDLSALREQMAYYVGEKNRLDRNGVRVRRMVPKL